MALISPITLWRYFFGDIYVDGNLDVSGEITENSANVFTVLQAERTIYVNNVTGSDSNDGRSASTPFLTVQKAADEAGYQASSTQTIIQFATTGTAYTDEVIMDTYAVGKIRFKGDSTTPSNVVWRGRLATPALSAALDLRDCRAFIIVDGFTFDYSFYTFRTRRSRLDITNCAFTNTSYLVIDEGRSDITSTKGTYNLTYAGWTGNNFALALGVGTTCTVSDIVTASNFDRWVNISDGARYTVSSNAAQSYTHKAGATFGPFTIFVQGNGFYSISSNVTADGNDATPDADTSFIYNNGGSASGSFILGNLTMTLDDFDYRYNMADQGVTSISDDDSITWNETNVTNLAKFNIGTTGFDETSTPALDEAEWANVQFNSTVELMKQISYYLG